MANNKEKNPNIVKRNIAPIALTTALVVGKLAAGDSLSVEEFGQGVKNRVEEVTEAISIIPNTPPTL